MVSPNSGLKPDIGGPKNGKRDNTLPGRRFIEPSSIREGFWYRRERRLAPTWNRAVCGCIAALEVRIRSFINVPSETTASAKTQWQGHTRVRRRWLVGACRQRVR
jgi:hypothetical protein